MGPPARAAEAVEQVRIAYSPESEVVVDDPSAMDTLKTPKLPGVDYCWEPA